jgi:hypothetical protein
MGQRTGNGIDQPFIRGDKLAAYLQTQCNVQHIVDGAPMRHSEIPGSIKQVGR